MVLGVDIKDAALDTFQRNHIREDGSRASIINGDIRQIEVPELQSALARMGVPHSELDCLIGGPPCQGFSQLRRSKERCENKIVRFRGYDRLDEDSRNDLVLRFLEVAAVLRPKVIVIENVPQMLSHVHEGMDGGLAILIENVLRQMGYEVGDRVLNAADFGVPQIRERVFIIASRVGAAEFPLRTHSDAPAMKRSPSACTPWVTVGEAIDDLPDPRPGPADILGGGPVTSYRPAPFSSYARRMRSSRHFPYNHVTRDYEESVLSIIRNMRPGETWDEGSVRMQQQYHQLISSEKRPGEDFHRCRERLTKSGAIIPTFYKSYYWSAYTRLDSKRPALTITANANFLGSGRFTHPINERGITMREAARLQSFGDDFTFLTSVNGRTLTSNIGVGLDMIGEAVPPALAEAIAKCIGEMLRSSHPIVGPDEGRRSTGEATEQLSA